MRKDLLRETRRQFQSILKTELGDFRPLADAGLGPGTDLYVRRLASDLSVFISLVPNQKAYRDSFMIELGWGNSDRPKSVRFANKASINFQEDGTVRLPVLWREQWDSALEPWWEIGGSLSLGNLGEYYSEAEIQRRFSAIPGTVRDAVAKIRTYALPLFRTIATSRGYPDVKL